MSALKFLWLVFPVVSLGFFMSNCSDKKKAIEFCSISKNASQLEMGEFYQRIYRIRLEVVDLTSRDDLFSVREFVEVYENPERYYSSAIAMIQDEKIKELDKQIAINAMTRLPIECFSDIVYTCYMAYKKDAISEDLLEGVLLHNFGKRQPLLEFRNSASVDKLVESILEDKDLSSSLRIVLTRIQDEE